MKPDHAATRHTDVAAIGRRSPKAIVCLVSALEYHGTDVAVEALQDCLRKRKATPADIFEMAKVDRVARVMRPYLEALT